jgi:hypothetical protein
MPRRSALVYELLNWRDAQRELKATADRAAGSGWLHCMDRPDHFECRVRITNQVFRAMNSAT